jgi:hypothetical protein
LTRRENGKEKTESRGNCRATPRPAEVSVRGQDLRRGCPIGPCFGSYLSPLASRVRRVDPDTRTKSRLSQKAAPQKAARYLIVKAHTLAPIVTSYTKGFSHFVTSMTAPVASGWSVRRVGLAPTGKRRLVTAHTLSGRRGSRPTNGANARASGRKPPRLEGTDPPESRPHGDTFFGHIQCQIGRIWYAGHIAERFQYFRLSTA